MLNIVPVSLLKPLQRLRVAAASTHKPRLAIGVDCGEIFILQWYQKIVC